MEKKPIFTLVAEYTEYKENPQQLDPDSVAFIAEYGLEKVIALEKEYNFVPSNGSEGLILTKTSSGQEWKDPDMSDYYTKDEVDSIDSLLKQWVENKQYLTTHQSLEDYATKEYVDTAVKSVDVTEQLQDYVTKTYAEETYLKEHLSLENYATKEYTDNACQTVKSELLGDDLEDTFNTLKAVQDWANEHGEAAVALANEVSNKANKSDITDMATRTWSNEEFATKQEFQDITTSYSSQISELTSALNTLKVNVATLQTFVNQFPETGDEVYAIVNRKADTICPAAYNIVVNPLVSATTLAIQSLQNGSIPTGLDEKIYVELKDLLGDEIFNELIVDAVKTMELTPELTEEEKLELAKELYLLRKTMPLISPMFELLNNQKDELVQQS